MNWLLFLHDRLSVLVVDCNALERTATHCDTLQHPATHCNTLQHTAAHCKTSYKSFPPDHNGRVEMRRCLQCVAVCCRVLQCVAGCCSVLQCIGRVEMRRHLQVTGSMDHSLYSFSKAKEGATFGPPWVRDSLNSWLIEFVMCIGHGIDGVLALFLVKSQRRRHIGDSLSSWLVEFVILISDGIDGVLAPFLVKSQRRRHVGDAMSLWLVDFVTRDSLSSCCYRWRDSCVFARFLVNMQRRRHVGDSLSSWLVEFVIFISDGIHAYSLASLSTCKEGATLVTHWVCDVYRSRHLYMSRTRWVYDIHRDGVLAVFLLKSRRRRHVRASLSSWLVEFVTYWVRDVYRSRDWWGIRSIPCQKPEKALHWWRIEFVTHVICISHMIHEVLAIFFLKGQRRRNIRDSLSSWLIEFVTYGVRDMYRSHDW